MGIKVEYRLPREGWKRGRNWGRTNRNQAKKVCVRRRKKGSAADNLGLVQSQGRKNGVEGGERKITPGGQRKTQQCKHVSGENDEGNGSFAIFNLLSKENSRNPDEVAGGGRLQESPP